MGVLVDLAFISGLFRIGCLVNVLICLLNALTYLRLSNLLNNPVYLLSYTFLMLIHFLKAFGVLMTLLRLLLVLSN